MKLNKDEIQKVFLAGLILAVVLYVYSTMLLGGLQKQESGARKTIAELEPRIATARKQIAATHGLETDAAQVSNTLAEIQALIPDGAPVAWFPPQMSDYFRRQGIEKSVTRFNNEIGVESLTEFKQLGWSIDLPRVGFVPLGIALAGLENQFPLLEIGNLQIEAGLENPGLQHIILTVNTLVNR